MSPLPSPSPNGGINTRTTLVANRNRRLKMNKSPKSKSQSITGRDGYVMAQALARPRPSLSPIGLTTDKSRSELVKYD